MVSDNDAYNRLYEFLGREYINQQLHQKGYSDVQLLHRLSIPLSQEQNRMTNPINFLDSNNKVLYSQAMQYDHSKYQLRQDLLGKEYYSGNELVNGSMDFSTKTGSACKICTTFY